MEILLTVGQLWGKDWNVIWLSKSDCPDFIIKWDLVSLLLTKYNCIKNAATSLCTGLVPGDWCGSAGSHLFQKQHQGNFVLAGFVQDQVSFILPQLAWAQHKLHIMCSS